NGLVSSAVQIATLPQTNVGGTIGYDYGNLVGPQDVDLFQVVAPDNGVLHINLDLPSQYALDPYIKVYWKNRSTGQIQYVDGRAGTKEDIRTYRGDVLFVGISDYYNQNYDPTNLNNRTNSNEAGGIYYLNLSFTSNDLNGSIDQARTDIAVGTVNQA